jgi:opacity protein-like surface antigen
MPMKISSRARAVAGLACAAFAGVGQAQAQAQAQSEWEYALSGYGWFTGLSTELDTAFGTVEAELSFGDILDELDFAAFAAFEARNGRVALVTDLAYAKISANNDTPVGLAFDSVAVDTRLTIFSAFAAYSVIDRSDLRVDLAGGFRSYDVSIDVDLTAALPIGNRSASFGERWVDPVVGARVRAPLSDDWFFNGFVDVGGFGLGDASDLSWQIYAGVGYEFNETWSMQGGYRYLSIDKEIDGRDTHLELYGPLIGVTARF